MMDAMQTTPIDSKTRAGRATRGARAGSRRRRPSGRRRPEHRRRRDHDRRDRGARPVGPGSQPRRPLRRRGASDGGRLWGSPTRSRVSVASMLAFNFFFLEPLHTLTLSGFAQLVRAARVRRHLGRRLRARDPLAAAGTRGLRSSRRSRRRCSSTAPSAPSSSASPPTRPGRFARRARGDHARGRVRGRATSSPPAGAGSGRSGSKGGGTDASAPPAAAARARLAARRGDRPGAARRARRSRPRRSVAPTRSRPPLLRAVSHDLRTPLMAISTSAGALARPEPGDRRCRPRRAARDDPRRLRPARPPRRQPARPLAPPGRRGRARAEAARARGARRRRARRARRAGARVSR